MAYPMYDTYAPQQQQVGFPLSHSLSRRASMYSQHPNDLVYDTGAGVYGDVSPPTPPLPLHLFWNANGRLLVVCVPPTLVPDLRAHAPSEPIQRPR